MIEVFVAIYLLLGCAWLLFLLIGERDIVGEIADETMAPGWLVLFAAFLACMLWVLFWPFFFLLTFAKTFK